MADGPGKPCDGIEAAQETRLFTSSKYEGDGSC